MIDKNQEELFENYWVKIESNIGQAKMSTFITDYLQFSCKETVSTQNAYNIFKKHFVDKAYTNETMLQELLHYSEYYNAFLNGNKLKYSHIVNKRLSGLKALDQGTVYQFLFHIFDDYKHNNTKNKYAIYLQR